MRSLGESVMCPSNFEVRGVRVLTRSTPGGVATQRPLFSPRMRLAYGISRLVLAAVGVGSCADSFGPIGIFSRAGEGGTFTRDHAVNRGSEKWKNKPSYNVFHRSQRVSVGASSKRNSNRLAQ